jgi:hypothetical protein
VEKNDIEKQIDLLSRLYNWISSCQIDSPHLLPNASVALAEIDNSIDYLKSKLN